MRRGVTMAKQGLKRTVQFLGQACGAGEVEFVDNARHRAAASEPARRERQTGERERARETEIESHRFDRADRARGDVWARAEVRPRRVGAPPAVGMPGDKGVALPGAIAPLLIDVPLVPELSPGGSPGSILPCTKSRAAAVILALEAVTWRH